MDLEKNPNRQEEDPYPGLVVEVELRDGSPSVRWLTFSGKHYPLFGSFPAYGIEIPEGSGFHVGAQGLETFYSQNEAYKEACEQGRMIHVERGANLEP